MYTP